MSFLPDVIGRFELGKVVISSGVYAATLERSPLGPFVRFCLERHVLGEWGICNPDDVVHNDAAVSGGKGSRRTVAPWFCRSVLKSSCTAVLQLK